MDSAAVNVSARKQVIAQAGSAAYKNGSRMISVSRIAMSRPLNVPIGGRSWRTRRKYHSPPRLTRTTAASATPHSVQLCSVTETAKAWAFGMSCSYECLRAGERGLVQVASGPAQRCGLVVGHERQVRVQAGLGEVPPGRGLAEPIERAGRQGQPEPAVPHLGAVARGPRHGGQRLDRLHELPRGDHLVLAQVQQVIGLAEELANGGRGG